MHPTVKHDRPPFELDDDAGASHFAARAEGHNLHRVRSTIRGAHTVEKDAEWPTPGRTRGVGRRAALIMLEWMLLHTAPINFNTSRNSSEFHNIAGGAKNRVFDITGYSINTLYAIMQPSVHPPNMSTAHA